MSLSVGRITRLLHCIAPSNLAEPWDNVGLQIGNLMWKVKKIWTALDPLPFVVENACENNIDLLITHHPLFFQPLYRVDTVTTKGYIIDLALKNHLAIFCAHTNFDSAIGGVNDILANKIGLEKINILKRKIDTDLCKLVIFTPPNSQNTILEVLFSLGAGQIGNYHSCSFRNKGLGTFLPKQESTPRVGMHESLSEVEEIRIESVLKKHQVGNVLDALRNVHPYETMAYDIFPILTEKSTGIGRVGNLKNSVLLSDLAASLKSLLNIKIIKVSGNMNTLIKSVAICSGSGSKNMDDFFMSGAQVYVSGDIDYHNARKAEERGLAVIDLGHFYSEQIAMENLATQLKPILGKIDKSVSISSAGIETDVFQFV